MRHPAKHRLLPFFTAASLGAPLGLVLAQATPVFPAANWTPLTIGGAAIVDAALDTSVAAPGRDLVGDLTNAAAFVASDADFLYFRLRLDGAANLSSFGYGCEIDTNGADTAYELLALTAKTSVALYRNTIVSDSPGDTAESLLQTYALADYAASSAAATNFSGTNDGFASWAVPWADLAAQSVVTYGPLRFVCGANSNGGPSLTTGTSGDVLGEGSADNRSWHQLASDQYQCGETGCIASACPAAPGAFISADNATFTIGSDNAFRIVASGCPVPSLSVDTLPSGLVFDPPSGVLSGTAQGASAGVVEITFTASNGFGSDAQQLFTLTLLADDHIFTNGFEMP